MEEMVRLLMGLLNVGGKLGLFKLVLSGYLRCYCSSSVLFSVTSVAAPFNGEPTGLSGPWFYTLRRLTWSFGESVGRGGKFGGACCFCWLSGLGEGSFFSSSS